jgi:hypothetical protein
MMTTMGCKTIIISVIILKITVIIEVATSVDFKIEVYGYKQISNHCF